MADEKLNMSLEETPQPSLFDAGPADAPAPEAPEPEPLTPENTLGLLHIGAGETRFPIIYRRRHMMELPKNGK